MRQGAVGASKGSSLPLSLVRVSFAELSSQIIEALRFESS